VTRGREKPLKGVVTLKRDSAAAQEFDYEEHKRNDKQQVHQTTTDVGDHAQQPKNKQKQQDRPKHVRLSYPVFLSSR
jgi:hypothetical protein